MSSGAATREIGVGIIGQGVMGRQHVAAYHAARAAGWACRVVAICDADTSKMAGGSIGGNLAAGSVTLDGVGLYARTQDLLRDERVDLVSICTPTDTHVDLAIAAMAAGKHVLVEKPVALASAEVRRLADAAARSGRVCMPAMCMRFWPGWDWLHARIHDGAYGRLRSVVFHRLGAGPDWSKGFYHDVSRSGGALVDLHIHDVDFIVWCFGKPTAVRSAGSDWHVTTLYEVEGGPEHVVAESCWTLAKSAGFRMQYRAEFERATAEFDISKSPRLVVHGEAGSTPIDLPEGTGYDGEVRHIVEVILGGGRPRATLEEAAIVAEVLERERESVRGRGVVRV